MEPQKFERPVCHDKNSERRFISGLMQRLRGPGLCRIVWMTRLSFGVPAVIGRWKQRNVRRLRSVWWIFATYVLGAAWRRSAPLQTKRAEWCRSPALVGSHRRLRFVRRPPLYIHVEIKQRRRGSNGIFEIGWVAFAWQFAGEKEAHFERHKYGRPRERARHHRALP